MPWMIVKDGDMFCVHKQNEDKTAGEKVKCHPDRAAAVAHMKALYTNVKEEALTPEQLEEVRKRYDLAETYGGVERKDLKASDFVFGDERAFPVMTRQDVRDAVSSWGRYRGKHSFEEFRSRLKALAKRKGLQSALPESWKTADESLFVSVELQDDSLNQRLFAVQEAFNAVTQSPPQQVNPYCYVKEVFDDYVIAAEEDGKIYKATYTVSDGKVTFQPRDQWIEVKQEYVEMSMFLFTELTASMLKQFDGMAANADVPFVSMSGEEVTVKPEDLEDYVTNTRAIIESTTTESGEVVGLPIDLDGHDHKGGAGWIKAIELDKARNVIRFMAEWTEEGAKVIKENIRRFFSPSIDPDTKAIRGGSLTNWPASRNGRGQILLRPIELSQTMKGIDMPKTMEELAAQLEQVTAAVGELAKKLGVTEHSDEISDEPLSPELVELLGKSDIVEVMSKEASQRAADVIKFEKRKQHIVEFAAKIAGGTRDKPYGLPVKTGDLVALLLRLPERDSLAVEKVLEKTWHNAIDFAERGVGGGDYLSLRPLPKEFHSAMKNWVAAGNSPESFFEANPEAGLAGDYNLREFQKNPEQEV